MNGFNDIDLTGDSSRTERPEPTPPAAAEAADPNALPTGDSILNILADVESQLARLRAAQGEQDDQLASLEARTRAVEELERELDRRAKAISQHESDSGARAAAVEQQTRAIEGERQRIEAAAKELDGRSRALGQQSDLRHRLEQAEANVGELIAKLESTQAALEGAQADAATSNDRVSDLDLKLNDVTEKLDTAHSALREKSAQLRALTERATKLSEQVEQLLSQVDRDSSAAAQLREQMAALERKAEAQSKALADSNERARQAEATGLALAEQADGARARVQEELDRALRQQVESKRSSQAEIEAARGKLDAARAELAQAQRESERELGRLTVRNESLQDELKAAREQAARERAAAESAARETAETVAKLEKDVAQQQSQAQSAATESASLRKGVAERDQTIARQEETLRSAKAKLTKFAEAIGQQAEQIQRGADALAMVREQKKQIDRLKEQLAAAMLSGNPEELARRDERIKELTEALRQARGQSLSSDGATEQVERFQTLQNEVDALKTELERSRIELGEARTAADRKQNEAPPRNDVEIAALNARITELEAQLAAAQTQPAKNASEAAAATDLRQKALKVRHLAEHLRRRRDRLARVKKLIAKRAQAKSDAVGSMPSLDEQRATQAEIEQRLQLAARIQRDREVLNEAARCLAKSERGMIRKWARPRAIATMGWLLVIAAVAATASWFAADAAFPAMRTASLRVSAEKRPGSEFSPSQAAAWGEWHSQFLRDDAFIKTLAERFEERQMASYSDSDVIRAQFEQSLTIDASNDGELVLTLSGTDGALAQVLDTIGLTLASESRRQQGSRIDGRRAVLPDERTEGGRIVYASLNASALADERLVRALYIFLGLLGALFLLAIIVYRWLSRSDGVFQSNEFDVAD